MRKADRGSSFSQALTSQATMTSKPFFFITNPGMPIHDLNMTLVVMGIKGQNVFVCVQYPRPQFLEQLHYKPIGAFVKTDPRIVVLGGDVNLATVVCDQPVLPARPDDRFVFFRKSVNDIKEGGDKCFNDIQLYASKVGQNINLEAVKAAILELCELVSV